MEEHTTPAKHAAAARRHDAAADGHVRSAVFWMEAGDEERAGLHTRAADLERQLAELERDWARLVARDEGARPR